MTYFRELPNLEYQSFLSDSKSSDQYLLVKNLFRRVKLRDDLQNVFTVFDKYQIPDGSRPELVAQELYGSTQYDWVVIVSAGITRLRDQWPLSDRQVYDYAESIYGNDLNAIHHYETKEVRDSEDRLILPAGQIVDADFSFVYQDNQKDYSNSLNKISYTRICAEDSPVNSNIIKVSPSGRGYLKNGDELFVNQTYIPIASVTDGTIITGVTTSFVGVATVFGNIGVTTSIISGVTTTRINVGDTLNPLTGIVGSGTTVTDIGVETVYVSPATLNTTPLSIVKLSFGRYVTTITTENTKNISLSSAIPVNISRGNNLTFKYNNTVIITTNPVIGISNYEYEVRKNNDKRGIYVLKPRYLQQVINDTRKAMIYDRSSQYVNDTLIKTENTKSSIPF